MLKINRTLEYALMAIKYVEEKKSLCSAKEISEALQISFDTTARVMQYMAQGQILRAEHGAGGGYRLVKKLSEITLDELVNIVEGPISLVKCLNGGLACEIQGHCSIESGVQYLNFKVMNLFREINLEELLKQQKTKDAKENASEQCHLG